MDRIQIALPVDVMEEIQEIALDENRSPKQQIEHYVMKAVRAAQRQRQRSLVTADSAT
jgi:hypothetical protein